MPPEQKKFSIFRLEFPGSDAQLTRLVELMNDTTKQAVRRHLRVDFLFMIGAYIGIGILCYKTFLLLHDTHPEASYFLLLMAVLQLVAFACDASENILLLKKLNNISSWNEATHERFSKIVFYKFMIALLGLATVVCSWVYMWLIHLIGLRYVKGVSIAVAIFILYIMIKALYRKRQRQSKEKQELLAGRQMINA